MNYTVDYFIEKFSKIPSKKWTMRRYANGKGAYCALGHCGEYNRGLGSKPNFTIESLALRKLFIKKLSSEVADINDSYKVFGKTPKIRILTALEKIKAKQND